jgi:DNA-binding protein HU-beta
LDPLGGIIFGYFAGDSRFPGIDCIAKCGLKSAHRTSWQRVNLSKCCHEQHNSKGGPDVNKNDLVAKVAELTGLSKLDSGKAIDAVFDAVTDALKGGDEVRLVGFGTFAVSQRAASEGRNPRTGETIKIAASKQPKFKAGKGLRDAVNG